MSVVFQNQILPSVSKNGESMDWGAFLCAGIQLRSMNNGGVKQQHAAPPPPASPFSALGCVWGFCGTPKKGQGPSPCSPCGPSLPSWSCSLIVCPCFPFSASHLYANAAQREGLMGGGAGGLPCTMGANWE